VRESGKGGDGGQEEMGTRRWGDGDKGRWGQGEMTIKGKG